MLIREWERLTTVVMLCTFASRQVADIRDEHLDSGVFVVVFRQSFYHLGVQQVTDLTVRRQVVLIVLQDRVHCLYHTLS